MKPPPADTAALRERAVAAFCDDLWGPGFTRTEALRATLIATDERELPAIRGELREQIGEPA